MRKTLRRDEAYEIEHGLWIAWSFANIETQEVEFHVMREPDALQSGAFEGDYCGQMPDYDIQAAMGRVCRKARRDASTGKH